MYVDAGLFAYLEGSAVGRELEENITFYKFASYTEELQLSSTKHTTFGLSRTSGSSLSLE